eukprot:1194674-Prorocentrum_minimum.AAC.5
MGPTGLLKCYGDDICNLIAKFVKMLADSATVPVPGGIVKTPVTKQNPVTHVQGGEGSRQGCPRHGPSVMRKRNCVQQVFVLERTE